MNEFTFLGSGMSIVLNMKTLEEGGRFSEFNIV